MTGSVWQFAGSPYRSSDVSASDMGMLSPIVTGKRSSVGGVGSNTVLGSIPVKRARSSAANLRPRATHLSTSPGTFLLLKDSIIICHCLTL
jgi:hypothetical protein